SRRSRNDIFFLSPFENMTGSHFSLVKSIPLLLQGYLFTVCLNTCSTDPAFSYRHYAKSTKPRIIHRYRS
ncbi:hypothetical protein MJM04_19840, partial [Salmonella enterica subsp. enterica serovar Cerro]|nr:hypothetical protein [Salmonella enterica subsp. enterica serovar Cerro]